MIISVTTCDQRILMKSHIARGVFFLCENLMWHSTASAAGELEGKFLVLDRH